MNGSNTDGRLRALLIIASVAALVFVPFLGAIPLFDWDEVNFAEVSREMILTGDYLRPRVDFVPFWEKPPMFFWMQVISMRIWGVGEFAARFPNAICGVATLCLTYLLGRKIYDHKFGILWTVAFGGSLLPHLYFRSGIIDPWFNLFIFGSIVCLMHGAPVRRKNSALWIGGGILLGLAVLTKGPVAFLIVALTMIAFTIIRRSQWRSLVPAGMLVFSIAIAVCALWYGIEYVRNGPSFMSKFIEYQWDLLRHPGAGHKGFPGYHVFVLLLGCFPASIFAIQPLFQQGEQNPMQREFRIWMICLFWVVLILFSIVESKIVHYSSLCYFPMTFLAAVYLWNLIQRNAALGMWQRIGVVSIAALYVLAGFALVFSGMHPEILESIEFPDIDARNSLTVLVDWTWISVVPIIFLLIAIWLILIINGTRLYLRSLLLFGCTAAFAFLGISLWVGKIQQYSQGPATEFYQSLRGKNVYIVPWGHKSYSQYWDFRKPLPKGFDGRQTGDYDTDMRYSDPEFLLTSPDVQSDVYVVTKQSKAKEFSERYPRAEKLRERGGFVFWVSHPLHPQ